MGIIAVASGSSCWRGLEYYKTKKVKNIKKLSAFEFTSDVQGRDTYQVYLNIEHPRSSTCNCPLAKGKKIVCKHIVATYFEVIPNSAKKFEEEQLVFEEEEEEYKKRQYQNMVKFVNKMTKKDLVDEIICILNYAPEWVYDDFIKRNNIDGEL